SELKDVETGARGFLLTGDDRFLQPFAGAVEAAKMNIGRLRILTAGDPVQQHRLDILEPLVAQRIALSTMHIAEKRAGHSVDPAKLLASKDVMDRIRAFTAEIYATERQLHTNLELATSDMTRYVEWSI